MNDSTTFSLWSPKNEQVRVFTEPRAAYEALIQAPAGWMLEEFFDATISRGVISCENPKAMERLERMAQDQTPNSPLRRTIRHLDRDDYPISWTKFVAEKWPQNVDLLAFAKTAMNRFFVKQNGAICFVGSRYNIHPKTGLIQDGYEMAGWVAKNLPGMDEKEEWAERPYRMVWLDPNHCAILSHAEGDLCLEVAPNHQVYEDLVQAAHRFYGTTEGVTV